MNDKEIFRLGTIRDVCEKRIKRKDAAQLLIDDATGKLMNLRFSETESAFD